MKQAERVNERKRVETPNSDINVTPLVDVVLVLLIIFMVITPMLNEDVILPKAKHHKRAPKEDNEKIMLVIMRDKKVLVGKDEVKLDELPTTLKTTYQTRADKSLYLKADESLHWGEVMKVMDKAREGTVEEIALITEDYPAEEQ